MYNFFGITYFSVLVRHNGKFLLTNGSYDDYVEKLYADERLSLRMEMFSKIIVPSLSKMNCEGVNYIHFIVCSHSLPLKYKIQLLEITNKYRFLRLVEVDFLSDLNIRTHILKEFEQMSAPKNIFGYFSLDDDDILSIDYLQNMKKYLQKNFLGMNIVFSKGYTTFYESGDTSLILREVRFPFINIGQMRICEFDGDKGIRIPNTGSHMLTDLSVPTIIDSTKHNFVWLRHAVQDTSSHFKNSEYLKKIMNDLNKYPIVNETISDVFPIVAKYISDKSTLLEKSSLLLNKKGIDVCILDEITNIKHCIIKYTLLSESSTAKQALIKFSFTRDLTDSEIVKSGLVLSRNGYYRYLSTTKDKNEEEFLVTIPSDVGTKAITLVKWGDSDSYIENITITK